MLQVKNTCVIKALNIIRTVNSDIFVIGKEMKIMGSIYNTPCMSSELGINIICESNNDINSWHINEITAKLLRLPYKQYHVIFPVLHIIYTIRKQYIINENVSLMEEGTDFWPNNRFFFIVYIIF